jgi:uncharacterized protein (DUF433 family)
VGQSHHRTSDGIAGTNEYNVQEHSPVGKCHLMNYQDYITIDPNKRGGKPCVRELRITVYEVLEYLASGMTEEEILSDFPDLTSEDLKACIAFAADRERQLMSAPYAMN